MTIVREFHEAFGHPIAEAPALPAMADRLLRVRLIAEELCEFARACGVRLSLDSGTTEGDEMVNVDADKFMTPDLVEAADALGDLRYVIDGGNLIFGFPGDAVLAEIHRSNMSKLGADGKPVYRDDRKVMKGPSYTPPDIAAVLARAGGAV